MVNRRKVVIVNKYGILIISVSIFYYKGISQIHNYYLKPTQSLKINNITNNKIGVFIFQRKGDTSDVVSNLNESLNSITIDYNNFDIHKIYTSNREACSKDSLYLILDGVEFLPHPYFQHFLILINSNNPEYIKIFNKRIPRVKQETITSDFKNINYKVAFKKVENVKDLINLISLPIDTSSYVTKTEFEIYSKKANYLVKQNNKYIDSIILLHKNLGAMEHSLSILLMPSFLNNLKIKHLQQSNTHIESSNFNNLQICYNRFNLLQNPALGYTMALSYSGINGMIRNNLAYNPLVDTIDRNAFNLNSERFILIGSATNIIEKFEFSSFGLSILGNIRKNVMLKNISSQIILSGGIKYSHIINATYSALSGNIRYDTLFYNKGTSNFIMGSTETIYSGKNSFKLNNRFYTGNIRINIVSSIRKLKNVYFCFGLNGEFGNNVITLPQEKETLLSENNNKYNSLFYRSNYFRLNSMGTQIGVQLKL